VALLLYPALAQQTSGPVTGAYRPRALGVIEGCYNEFQALLEVAFDEDFLSNAKCQVMCPSPLLTYKSCMQHRFLCCASTAAKDDMSRPHQIYHPTGCTQSHWLAQSSANLTPLDPLLWLAVAVYGAWLCHRGHDHARVPLREHLPPGVS
jgi:hypothetical protein